MTIKRNYEIREPIWNGSLNKRQIGLAVNRIQNIDELRVQITKKNKHGKKIYPDTYVITPKFFKNYEGEIINRYGIELKLFFIDDLITVKEHNNYRKNKFLNEVSKYGKFRQLKIINNKETEVINGKSNTRNTKYKPTRSQI
jgi:hypothetical protein